MDLGPDGVTFALDEDDEDEGSAQELRASLSTEDGLVISLSLCLAPPATCHLPPAYCLLPSSLGRALRIRMHENCRLDATTASQSFHSDGITRSSISHASSSPSRSSIGTIASGTIGSRET
jgi:hypothetical protein